MICYIAPLLSSRVTLLTFPLSLHGCRSRGGALCARIGGMATILLIRPHPQAKDRAHIAQVFEQQEEGNKIQELFVAVANASLVTSVITTATTAGAT